MEARLKSTQEEGVMLNYIKPMQYAVVISGRDKGHIVFRPREDSGVFAVDLTDGYCWEEPELCNREVRILRAGELIEIVE